jgi:cellulose synthase/poly-beta-1,6-N-acetylglucosamine synthase-like glycosyltransferase
MSLFNNIKSFFRRKLFYILVILAILIFTFFVKSMSIYLQLFILAVYLYFLILSILISKKYSEVSKAEPFPDKTPTVAVVTYAFGNWTPIKKTITQLKKLKYPIPFNIYVITDGTCTFLKGDKQVKPILIDKKYFVKSKKNLKSVIINQGLKHITEENIFEVDGDTIPEKDALMKMTGSLKGNVGIVVGVIGVTNTKKFVEKIQAIEYNFSFGLPRMVLTSMGSLDIGTGALCLFKRKDFLAVGGYNEHNITEDKDLAYKLIDRGQTIHFVVDAKAKTEVPDTWKKYYIQRIRWARGGIDTTNRYLSFLFNKKLGIFGYYLPYSLFILIMSMALIFRSVYNIIKDSVEYAYYHLLNYIHYGIEWGDITINFSNIFNVNSIIIILFISLLISIYFMGLSFRYTNHKLDYSYILPIIFLLMVYGFIIIMINIISIVQELFEVHSKWS